MTLGLDWEPSEGSSARPVDVPGLGHGTFGGETACHARPQR